MNKKAQSNSRQIETLVAHLNKAYSNNQLDGYRALELKDSVGEKTTCMVQWGPMMRA